MDETEVVKRIVAGAGDLNVSLNKGKAVAMREVQALRYAFDKQMTNKEKWEYSKKATQCDNLLTALQRRVADDPRSLTGDETTPELRSSQSKAQASGGGGGGAKQPGSTTSPSGNQEASSGKKNAASVSKRENWKFVNIPKARRTQTFIVSLFLFFTGVPAAIIVTILLCMNWFTLPFMVIYFAFILLQPVRHPLPKWAAWTKSPFWIHYRDYFPVRLVAPKSVRQKVLPQKNYMFIYHPHGVHSFGAIVNFGSDANNVSEVFPGITVHCQTLKANFLIPFWRELFRWGGCGDASAACIRKTLRAGPGESVLLVVGGAEESLLSSPLSNDLTLGKRKGFVKLALETGSPLVPTYGFGETNVYHNLADGRPWLQRYLRWSQKKLGFALPLIHGRGYFNYHFGVLPHRHPIVVVVGMPLEVPRIEKPTPADVDLWHAKYVEALVSLYRENKDVYAVTASEMKIVG
jgi:2-acylglycerol O-acyltransferase 2